MNGPLPSVDVGMPAHGKPTHLAAAVHSVLGQSHGDLRLLVLDDSGGEEIAAALTPFLADGRLEHRRAAPMSATQAMTALMRAGEAPYFAFLHDDDRWGPEFLARQVAFLERHPECALAFTGHVDIDEEGRETARYPAQFAEGIVPHEVIVPEMQRRNVIDVMHCVVARRSALEATGCRLDDDFPRLFDWELWLRLVLAGPVGCVSGEEPEYRAHGDQMSAKPGRADDFAALYEHADRLVAEHEPGLRLPPGQRRRRRAGLWLSRALDRLHEGEAEEASRALLRALRLDPRVVADRRAGALALGLLGGSAGRRAVEGMRARRYRRSFERRRGR